MSSDLIGRRRASEQRLDRARSLELLLKEKTDVLVETTGVPIEQLDFDGSFRAALTALAAVASRRSHFDVIVTLPDAPFAMRIQHVNNAVSAEVLVQRDGPFEPITATAYPVVPAPSVPVEPETADSYLGIPQAYLEPATPYTGVSFSETSESYAAASGTYGPGSETYVAAADTYVAASDIYAANSGTYSGASEVYSRANGAYSNGSETYSRTNETYSEAHETYSGTAEETFAGTSETYSEPSEGYSEVPGSYPESPKPARAISPGESTGVASDLADLLWQGVDDMPS